MKPEDIVKQLIGELSKFSGKINVLEQEVDVQVQEKYFDFSRNFKKRIKKGNLKNSIVELESEIPEERQKELLVMLSQKSGVKAYRAIEKFEKNADNEIKDWAKLALQEAKMLLESEFLDEKQLFISTGLGGSGSSLRYFIVLFLNKEKKFEDFQQKIVKNELSYLFKEYDSKLEEIKFINNFVTLTALIPLDTAINEMFKRSIEAINEFGDFMSYSFLLNNSKRMTPDEIKEIVDIERDKFERDNSTKSIDINLN